MSLVLDRECLENVNRGRYKIKSIAALTGFQPSLLRAWERRYHFLEPDRISSQHRLYSEEDLQVLLAVRQLISTGQSIGEVAALGREQLLLGIPGRVLPGPGKALQRAVPEEVQEQILDLAARGLDVHLRKRWAGQGLGVSIRRLPPNDLAIVMRLYQVVHGFYELWLYTREQPTLEVLCGRLAALREPHFVAQIQQLGVLASPEALVREALRDTRQGALPALLEYSQEPVPDYARLQICALLARDHAKLMRNAFVDLDIHLSDADLSPKAHAFRPMLSKMGQIFRIGLRHHLSLFGDFGARPSSLRSNPAGAPTHSSMVGRTGGFACSTGCFWARDRS